MTGHTSYHANSPVIDPQHALAAAGGDREVLREIAALFLADLPRRLDELRQAVQCGSLDRVVYLAHSLRGSAAVFGSKATADAALRLELLAQHGKRESFPDAAAQLELWMQRLAEAVSNDLVGNRT